MKFVVNALIGLLTTVAYGDETKVGVPVVVDPPKLYPLDPSCSFEDEHKDFDPNHAAQDAEAAHLRGDYYFYGVFVGLGPLRPGFDRTLTKCLMIDADWRFFNAGSDYRVCENREFLIAKGSEYAGAFNSVMLSLLENEPDFVCYEDLQSAR